MCEICLSHFEYKWLHTWLAMLISRTKLSVYVKKRGSINVVRMKNIVLIELSGFINKLMQVENFIFTLKDIKHLKRFTYKHMKRFTHEM